MSVLYFCFSGNQISRVISFSGDSSNSVVPPMRRLPAKLLLATPRRARRPLPPDARHRVSDARRDGRRPERPPGGGLRGVQHGAVQRFARHVGRELGRGEAARGGHRRVSVQAVGRGAPLGARRERDRLAPGAYRHQSLPREDARPRRRAFRATRVKRVDHRRQVVARRPGGGVSRRAVRFRRSRRAEKSGGFAADARRGFRGAARAP